MANSFVNFIYNQDFNPGYFLHHHTILVVTVEEVNVLQLLVLLYVITIVL